MPTSSAETRAAQAHLAVSGLQAGYGPVPIIRDLNLGVGRGEVVVVVGPNGAGKSTALKAVTGMIPPQAGTVTLGGSSLVGLPADKIQRSGIGFVPQIKDVFTRLSVRENLDMGGYTLDHRKVAERIEFVLDLFPQLKPLIRRGAGSLSGGERKQLAIARVLMTDPSLLILDEPTANLAPQPTQALLHEHVPALARHGTAVLLVEQRVREAFAVSDWAYVLVSGTVKLEGPPADLLARGDLNDVFLGGGGERLAVDGGS